MGEDIVEKEKLDLFLRESLNLYNCYLSMLKKIELDYTGIRSRYSLLGDAIDCFYGRSLLDFLPRDVSDIELDKIPPRDIIREESVEMLGVKMVEMIARLRKRLNDIERKELRDADDIDKLIEG